MSDAEQFSLADVRSADANTLLQLIVTAAKASDHQLSAKEVYGDYLRLLEDRSKVPSYLEQYCLQPKKEMTIGQLLPHPALLREGKVSFLKPKK